MLRKQELSKRWKILHLTHLASEKSESHQVVDAALLRSEPHSQNKYNTNMTDIQRVTKWYYYSGYNSF